MGDTVKHLDAQSWRSLQQKEPEAVKYFAAHLATACDVCEGFLAAESEPEQEDAFHLDALADETLGELSGPPREDAVGWARLRRRLGAPKRTWLAGAAAVAAMAAVLAISLRPEAVTQPSTSSQHLKGGVPLVLELSAMAQLPDGQTPPVADGAVLPPEAVVLLHYHASEASDALLVREAPGLPTQVLGRYALEPGTHPLLEGTDLAGVSLEGEQGPVTLVLVAWPKGPGSHEALEQAAEQATVPQDAVQARLRLRVEPGHAVP
ncbi:hypothetical protein JY651_01990 [Pyxidicoccus parkwayensis]|uniref:Transmembrane anti-sigma factor n=1 Tax=Pyxidicoccus parkwayensis TaxID=2813578 RepID=A0ABX7P1K7_9BACT|nr:hypothetical protein [Pyxidicoccus parkwaysis]QSQ23779.1 hypothetical protein JY651_01990 [Pyxidicoccus parkwaysis]